jgi:DNA end-binding protein Ku
VPWSDVKGYEYSKGQYVVVTDEDFEKARVPATQTFDIRAFVPANEVEDLYFEEPYYLEPNGQAGVKAYALLRDALKDTGRIDVGTVVLRQREHVAAVEPAGDALVLSMMRFAHEIRSPKDLSLPKAGEGWTKKEMDLAHRLIDTLAGKWNPHEFRDTYTDVLRQAIEAKVEGKQFEASREERRPQITNLKHSKKVSRARNPRRQRGGRQSLGRSTAAKRRSSSLGSRAASEATVQRTNRRSHSLRVLDLLPDVLDCLSARSMAGAESKFASARSALIPLPRPPMTDGLPRETDGRYRRARPGTRSTWYARRPKPPRGGRAEGVERPPRPSVAGRSDLVLTGQRGSAPVAAAACPRCDRRARSQTSRGRAGRRRPGNPAGRPIRATSTRPTVRMAS